MEKTAQHPIESVLASLPRQWLDGGVLELDHEQRFSNANFAFMNWLGVPVEDIDTVTLGELLSHVAPEWTSTIIASLDEGCFFKRIDLSLLHVSPPQSYQLELTQTQSGSLLRLSSTPPCPITEGQDPDPAVAWRERRIHMLEGLVNNLIGSAPCAFFFQHPDGKIAWTNDQIENFTGTSAKDWESDNRSVYDLFCQPEGQAVSKRIAQAAEAREEMDQSFTLCIKQGRGTKKIYIHEYRSPVVAGDVLVGWNCLWMDATRQNSAEKRVRNIIWRDTLANLAMGVCHDIKNKMAGASMVVEMLPERIENKEPTHTDLVMLSRSIEDASTLAKRIMEIAMEKAGTVEVFELTTFLRELLTLFHKSLSGRCQVEQMIFDQPLTAIGDKVELRRAVSNLILNAADASDQGTRIKVVVKKETEPTAGLISSGQLPKGPCIAISVKDAGTGIDPKNLSRLFDPFFTTKPLEKGTGLGLHIVSDIAKQHHGAVTVESELSKGSIITLWLPIARPDEHPENHLPSEPESEDYVLVAGFNDSQVDSISQFMRDRSYRVTTALSVREAISILKTGEKNVSCLYLLVNDPSPNMVELVTLARSLSSPPQIYFQTMGFDTEDLPTVFSSLADHVFPHDMQRRDIISFLDEQLR